MGINFTFKITPYNESYVMEKQTRATTNFANFAREPSRNRERIKAFLRLVNIDLNRLLCASETGPYEINLEIISIFIHFDQDLSGIGILLTETMRASVVDCNTNEVTPGPTGLNFSSYLRDYDFRIVLPQLIKRQATQQEWSSFGKLHGILTRLQFGDHGLISAPLTIALSIAQKHSYRATDHLHPVIGREYSCESLSLTDRYFAQMGLCVHFYRPENLPAPLAIYNTRPLMNENNIFLAALIAVMANFQRIYRPEIYLSRVPFASHPGEVSQASLANQDYHQPDLIYDRDEREQLSDQQAHFIEETLVKPYGSMLSQYLLLNTE